MAIFSPHLVYREVCVLLGRQVGGQVGGRMVSVSAASENLLQVGASDAGQQGPAGEPDRS